MAVDPISAVRVPRPLNDRNYGREEYIDYCVQRILQGNATFISSGSIDPSPESLPPLLREKYKGFFPGFKGALEEVVQGVERAGKKVIKKPLLNGNNSDALGLSDSGPDGYFVSLDPNLNTHKIT